MSTGQVLAGLEKRGITGYIPAGSSEPAAGSPVLRDDLTEPVGEEHRSNLPKNSQGQSDKSNLVYDKVQDEFRSPMGRASPYLDRKFSNGAETPFGYLKGVLGLRQFQRVGLEKVEQEWMWACMSLNVKKILKLLAKLRAMALEGMDELELEATTAA